MDDVVFRVSDVVGGYGRIPIVHGVSMTATKGHVVTIVGPNGAGKSTFLKLVAGMLNPTQGSVRLNDVELVHKPADQLVRAGLAYVPQEGNVFPHMSIRENLEMGGFILTGSLTARIEEQFALFPDLRLADRKQAGQLSGGQRNMLAMARALMLNPHVLLLDEPTAGLSPKYTDVVWQKVREIAARGTTIVIVEQNVSRAIANSDWVYVLIAGRNRIDGTPDDMARVDLSAMFLGKGGKSQTTVTP